MTSEFVIAVHALVYLYRMKETIASDVLAESVCTNPVCIRKVMGKLKKEGIVETKEGLNGGYRICEGGEQINLKTISDVLKIKLVKSSWHSGNTDKTCMICSGMAGIMGELVGDMDLLCREYLEKITIAEINGRIFRRES